MEAKIIFRDHTEITAEANGDCFIVDEQPAFPDDLNSVVIQKDGAETTVAHAMIQECASADGKYWFTLMEIPVEQIEKEELLAELEIQAQAIVELAALIGGIQNG